MKRVTMKDLAKAAGVSRPTVSRALKGDPQISAATTERIRALAKEMGYRPDPAFEVLARTRWGGEQRFRNTLGFLTHPDLHRQGYLDGAKRCAAKLGYTVDVLELSEYPSAKALDRVLEARGIRGVILPTFYAAYPMPDLNWDRYAVVACSVDAEPPPFHVVRSNVIRKVEIAWERCQEAGYRRIGIALAYEGPNELDLRREGAARQCLATQSEEHRIPLWNHPFQQIPSLQTWLEAHEPEVVIFGQPALGEQLHAHAERTGKTLPGCCLVRSRDVPCLSSHADRIGYLAVSVLHQQMMENETGIPEDPFTLVVEPKWVDGCGWPQG